MCSRAKFDAHLLHKSGGDSLRCLVGGAARCWQSGHCCGPRHVSRGFRSSSREVLCGAHKQYRTEQYRTNNVVSFALNVRRAIVCACEFLARTVLSTGACAYSQPLMERTKSTAIRGLANAFTLYIYFAI